MTTTTTTPKAKAAKRRMPAAASKIQVEMKFIDPVEAISIVEHHNPKNRKVDSRNVLKLVAQMEAGQWLPGVSIIKFDPKGNLVDGQHTLYAIEKSNIGQWVTVMRGVPSQALDVINTGKSMTLTTHPDIKDLPNSGIISALVFFIYKHQAGLTGQQLFGDIKNYSASMSGSITELLKTFKDNKEDIIRYSALGAKVNRSIPVTASTIAQAAWMFFPLDPVGADAFFEGLTTGAALEKDSPIYVLRERLLSDLGNKSTMRIPKWVVLAYIIKAWNFYQNGVKINRLRFDYGGTRSEAFPVPIAALGAEEVVSK